MVLALSRAGTGVGIVGSWFLHGQLDRTLVARPLHPRVARKLYAVFREQNPRALPMDAFVEVLRSTAKATATPPKQRSAPRSVRT